MVTPSPAISASAPMGGGSGILSSGTSQSEPLFRYRLYSCISCQYCTYWSKKVQFTAGQEAIVIQSDPNTMPLICEVEAHLGNFFPDSQPDLSEMIQEGKAPSRWRKAKCASQNDWSRIAAPSPEYRSCRVTLWDAARTVAVWQCRSLGRSLIS